MEEVKGQFFSLNEIRRYVIMMSLLSLIALITSVFAYIQYLEAETSKKQLIECQSKQPEK